MKHIQWLNDVLIDIKRTNCIIFEKKSQFCCEEFRIVEFVCDVEKRHSNTTKIIKILNWFSCQNVVDVREFIEVCVFYQVFIAISFLLLSLFMLFWKRMFYSLKNSLNKRQWTHSKSLLLIFRFLFSSIMKMMLLFSRWTRVLKIEKKNWWFCAMNKDIQCAMKMKSDQMQRRNTTASKKKYREILKALKKICFYFHDVKLILKTNVRVLVDQLNRFDTDLFDVLVTRWLA
jgi:hypothetical protein